MVGFWEEHNIWGVLLLLLPFFGIWKAMQSFPKSEEETKTLLSAQMETVEAKDPYTRHHCSQVSKWARNLAILCGMDPAQVETVEQAAQVHDLGKIFTRDSVLKKAGALTPEERLHIQGHTMLDDVFLKHIPPCPLRELIHLGRLHHENWDGNGYPKGLKGEEIPPAARIFVIVDVWDAITSDRVYRAGMSDEEAFKVMEKGRGTMFNPELLDIFYSGYKQGAIRSSRDTKPTTPVNTWKITKCDFHYTPSVKERAGFQPPPAKRFQFSKIAPFLYSLLILGATFFLYLSTNSPFQHEKMLFVGAMALVFEAMEVRYPGYLPIYPAEFIYAALLFFLPAHLLGALLLIGSGIFVLVRFQNIKFHDVLHLLYRAVVFMVPQLLIRQIWPVSPSQPGDFLAGLILWSILAAVLRFILNHLEVIIRQWKFKIFWDWEILTDALVLNALVIVPAALLDFVLINHLIHFFFGLYAYLVIFGFTYLIFRLYGYLQTANQAIITVDADAVDERFDWLKGHSKKVSELSKKIAARMGMSLRQIGRIKRAARVCDLGIVGISDEITTKLASLTSEEFVEMEGHVAMTLKILEPYSPYSDVLDIVKNHHAHWDGKGYPPGLKDKAIPIGSGIIAVADAFVAITSVRPYRNPLSKEDATQEIQSKSGTQFDPAVVKAFLEAL